MRLLAVDPGLSGIGAALFEGEELLQAWYSPGAPRKRLAYGALTDGAGTLDRGPHVWRSVAQSLAWLNDNPVTKPTHVVIEAMKVYSGRGAHAKDPNDLLQLSGVSGCVAMTFPDALLGYVPARDWKGQTPKRVFLARIETWLQRRGWQDRVVKPEKDPALVHNAIDAAGLGLVALGLEGKRVKVRFES